MHRAKLANHTTFFLLTALIAPTALFAAGPAIWSDVSEAQISLQGERWIVPSSYRTVALDSGALSTVLQAAPLEGSANAGVANVILALPLPDGTFASFRIQESPIMAPELAAKFPEIRTYNGQGIDEPTATVRFDQTPAGFHAVIHSTRGRIYIDPYSRGDVTHYISYFTRDHANAEAAAATRCLVGEEHGASAPDVSHLGGNLPNGDTLKTYRTAVAATGEYTRFHSADPNNPTSAEGLAAIVTAMNRVNEVYERDVAVRHVLVPNNELVVYTDPNTDPYTNNNGVAMLGQNQTNLDAVIGSANYDIGHVFSTGGGGIAQLRATCGPGKARGVTGLPQPTGDVFWIDFVAHELGHQWGGNHTFNGNAGACSGGNRNGGTAYEPGSGTTIQAYAGICGNQNIQGNSDDHFHNISYQEIVNFITVGNGNSCDAPTATGNTPPTPDAGDPFTIPINTPFELCGSATDPDGDALTYNWEQFNRGPAGHPNSPVGDAPIFRSFPSKESPCRMFPQLSDLLGNTQTLGELLPSYARTLTFRMLVRDNRAGGGGADYDEVDIEVVETAGPFLVTSPNTATNWDSGGTETVTWDVANTDIAPISCAQVDILLSTDGGENFDTTILTGTANDGSESVSVPDVASSEARVKVLCSDNVFFDISNENFTILEASIFADGFESGDTTRWTNTRP